VPPKKQTTTARPHVERLVTNLKTADGRPKTVDLGPKTLVIGPNGSGKSAVQQSLQLALLGSASPPWVPGAAAWHVSVPTPPDWPDVASFALHGLSVRAIKVNVVCTADAASVACDVSPQT
jgi:energy-coupling factor transporter ATP-binding protein EcfA2